MTMYIYLYAVQIKPKIYIKAQGISKLWQLLEYIYIWKESKTFERY